MKIDKLFTYFGNKERIAEMVWPLFGQTAAYVEPFAGCASMLLSSPYYHRFEAINDADCYIVNAFRSVKYHHKEVIKRLYNPRFEMDLHARQDYLVNHKTRFEKEMYRSDPKFCDPELAAWWIWGINLWIGSNWCSRNHTVKTLRTWSQKPTACNHGILNKGNRKEIIDSMVTKVFERLVDVNILYGDFERVLTPSYTTQFGTTAVFLDPPYVANEDCYEQADSDGSVWDRAMTWFINNKDNPQLRIVLCGEERQWPNPPKGIRTISWLRGSGYSRDKSVDNRKECIWTNIKESDNALFE